MRVMCGKKDADRGTSDGGNGQEERHSLCNRREESFQIQIGADWKLKDMPEFLLSL